jgi:non-ribosomal peptide synthetase component F
VQQHRDRLAVKTSTQIPTYEALNHMANRVVHAVLAEYAGGVQPVVVLLEKEAPLIAAILALLKTGKIYVPLDPALPRDRLRQIFAGAQAGLIVTNNRHLPCVRELAQPDCSILNLDGLASTLSTENLGLYIAPDTLACILYTSGSTGLLKGVLQNQVRRCTPVTSSCTNGTSLRTVFCMLGWVPQRRGR